MNASHLSAPVLHDFASHRSSSMEEPGAGDWQRDAAGTSVGEDADATAPVASAAPLLPKRGRPSSCTTAKVTAICALIRSTGISDTAAGALARVSRAALSRAKQDEDVETDLGQARAQYLLPRLTAIADTRLRDGQLDWRAQAWLIKFAMPEVYGPPSRRRRLEKIELPAAPMAAPGGGGENVTFRSEMPAVSRHSPSGGQEAEAPSRPADDSRRGNGAAFTSAAPGQTPKRVTIRSEITSNTADDPESEAAGRRQSDEELPTKCPETSSEPALPSASAGRHLSRRARRAEQRRQTREAGRVARQERAA